MTCTQWSYTKRWAARYQRTLADVHQHWERTMLQLLASNASPVSIIVVLMLANTMSGSSVQEMFVLAYLEQSIVHEQVW